MRTLQEIRSDFPILSRKINGYPLIYLDNAATTQKPQAVINALVDYYSYSNANIHRGVHFLSQEATELYENARKKIQYFLNAKHSHEILFTSGATEGINLIANGLTSFLKKNDEIWLLPSEHHSNIVPWQFLCERTGSVLREIPITSEGMICWEKFENCFTERMKVVSCQQVSNALGNIHNIEKVIQKAHDVGAISVIDAAQSASHFKIDVQALGMDFLVASGHKMYAPTGVGFLYGKEEWLEKLPPYKGGGEMIASVSFRETTYAKLPYKFEAGTPNIADGIAFGVAIDYINEIGLDTISNHEHQLLEYATKKLSEIPKIQIYGTEDLSQKTSVISFNIKGIHSYDVGTILDKMGIAIRTGHHCAQPIMDFYEITGTARASFAIYNSFEEIDTFINAVKKAQQMLS